MYDHDNPRIISETIQEPSDPSMKSKFNEFSRLIRQNSRNRYKPLVSLFVLAVLGVGSLALSQRLLSPVGEATRSQAAVPQARVSTALDNELQTSSKTVAIVHLKATPATKENIKKVQDDLLLALRGYNFSVRNRFEFASAIVLEVDGPTLGKLKTLGDYISSIENNFHLKPQAQQARKIIMTPEAETAGYVPANNIAVVVVDTGVNAAHPFLKNRVVDEACFGEECPAANGPGSAVACTWNTNPAGGCNHGTLVAGLVTGGDTGTSDRFAGIAPGVKIIAIRMARRQPPITAGAQDDVVMWQEDMIAAANWVLGKVQDPTYPYKIAAVNMSLSTTGDMSSLCGDVNDHSNFIGQLWDAKAPIVASAMNNRSPSGLGNPACSPLAIPVGSVTKQKQVSGFSNAAPWHPNFILAPGGTGDDVSVPAPAAENIKSSTGTNAYAETAGTSFAAPQVAAAIALMRSIAPNTPVEEFIKAIKTTGIQVTDTRTNTIYSLIQVKPALDYLKSTAAAWSATTSCSATTGTSTTCNMSATLGASTEKEDVLGIDSLSTDTEVGSGTVLQATTQATHGKLMLVTAAYRGDSAYPNLQISSMSYCGAAMSRLGGATGRAKYTDQHLEMWYLFNASGATCPLKANFTRSLSDLTPADPKDRILTRTFFENVPFTNFLSGIVRIAGYNYPPGSTFLDLRDTGPKNSRFVCTYSNYPNGGQNVITSTSYQWRQVWGSGKVVPNVQSAIGVSDQRTSDGQSINIKWNGTQSWPWAGLCINLNQTAPTGGGTTPPPPPSPTPVPKTSVVLKINGSDGPVTAKAGDILTFNWYPVSANVCTASGGAWTGGKSIANGLDSQIALVGSTTYKITCTGNATASDSVVVNTPPSIDLRVNGSSEDFTIDKGVVPFVNWSVVGATSCTASGGWIGAKAIKVGTEKMIRPLTVDTKYTLSCTGAGGTTSKSVTAKVGTITAPIGYRAEYFADTNFAVSVGSQNVTSINYDWGTTGVPFPGLQLNYYSARYTAQFTPTTTGTYTFITTSDDGVRLYIDDKPVILDWIYHGRSQKSGTMTLTAGVPYNLVIEYVETSGGATMIFQAGIGTSPAPLNPKATKVSLGMNGGGFRGYYYTDSNYTSHSATDTTPVLDVLWVTMPDTKLPYNHKSVRYAGTLTPTVSSTYSFQVSTGAELYINGVKKVFTNGITTHAMTANVNYNVTVQSKLATFTQVFLRWKYGSLPYTSVDFRNMKPSN